MAARYAQIGSGKICTVIAPTNCHWDPSAGTPVAEAPISTPRVSPETIQACVALLSNGKKSGLMLGVHALHNEGLEIAGRIAAKTGAALMAETMPARMARGEGRIPVPVVPYQLEAAMKFFADYEQVILVGALHPVSTFAYRNMSTMKVPAGCEVWTYATPDHDVLPALQDLADAVGATDATLAREPRVEPAVPRGELTPKAIGASLSVLLPDDAILIDEAITLSGVIIPLTQGARRHDFLYAGNGAAIGAGLPLALGAAIARPDRKVVLLQADGSGMYTNQALWSMAREGCDITVVILKNDAYGILNIELARVREGDPSDKTLSMLKLDRPSIDWVQIAQGMGVPATHADTADAFHAQLQEAIGQRGPRLIEATIAEYLQPVIDAVYKESHQARVAN